ncbi:bifunctional folylpolyglutamate synthase/dihydrofolate synthase [Novosphingobium colocasiae]
MARPADFAVSDNPEVQAQLDRLAALSLPQGRIGLEPVRELLDRLGNPQRSLPPVFHVAGTNGKGSTCAFLRAALEAADHRVHVFTSPHLVRFNERIRVSGALISDDLLAELLAEVLDEAEAGAIAVSFFSRWRRRRRSSPFRASLPMPASSRSAWAGGWTPPMCWKPPRRVRDRLARHRPRSVPARPPKPVFLPSRWRGSRSKKAGIAKPGVPLVTLAYGQDAVDAVEEQAERVIAPVFRQGRDWSIRAQDGGLLYRDHHGDLALPLPALAGAHQTANAALAIAMLRHQDALPIADEALAAAMGRANWPARLQRLADGPVTRLLPPATPCWLDGGHNPDAGAALGVHFAGSSAPIHLVIGMLANKHPEALIAPLRRHLASVTVVPVPGHEYHAASAFRALFPQADEADDVETALRELSVAPGDTVLIAGSLYLAGTVLAANGQLPD